MRGPGLLTFFFCHAQDILRIDLAHHLGVVTRQVRLDLCEEFLVGVSADDLAAFAVDQLAHEALRS